VRFRPGRNVRYASNTDRIDASQQNVAIRRSELVALDVEDLEESELGFKVAIRHSKTDQEGTGQIIAIGRGSVACPVVALKTWLAAAGITSGAIFRSVRKGGAVGGRLSAQAVAHVVKDYAERVELDPALFAGHSKRSGFLTSGGACVGGRGIWLDGRLATASEKRRFCDDHHGAVDGQA
jgi:hypothetical protein